MPAAVWLLLYFLVAKSIAQLTTVSPAGPTDVFYISEFYYWFGSAALLVCILLLAANVYVAFILYKKIREAAPLPSPSNPSVAPSSTATIESAKSAEYSKLCPSSITKSEAVQNTKVKSKEDDDSSRSASRSDRSSRRERRRSRLSKDELIKQFLNDPSLKNQKTLSPVKSSDGEVSCEIKSKSGSAEAITGKSSVKKPEDVVTDRQFLAFAKELAKFSVYYRGQSKENGPFPAGQPNILYAKIPKEAPQNPQAFATILTEFKDDVVKKLTNRQHSLFMAHFGTCPTYADQLAELLIASLGVVSNDWSSCPALVELDAAMVNWMGRAIGLPDQFLFGADLNTSPGGGVLMESASDGIFSAILAARKKKYKEFLNSVRDPEMSSSANDSQEENDTEHELVSRFVAYGSKDADPFFENGCKMALIRCRSIQAKSQNNWGITGDQLEREIKKDLVKGLVPCMVFVTSGTTSSAHSDDLNSIGPVAKKYKMWIHLDASYAGNAWICPEMRYQPDALKHLDSINVNASQWMNIGLHQSFFWTSRRRQFQEAFAVLERSNCLDREVRSWGIDDSVRFRSLKTWIFFRLYGVEGLQKFIRKLCDQTSFLAELVKKHANTEVFSLNFSLLTFYYKEPEMNQDQINENTKNLLLYINATRKITLTQTRVDKQYLIRMSVMYELSTDKDVEDAWNLVKDLIKEFQEKKKSDILPVIPQPFLPLGPAISLDSIHSAGISKTVSVSDKTAASPLPKV